VTIICHHSVTKGDEVPRDRFATRTAILESAAELLAAHGAGAVGVNALAHAAGCDKVLIYRYFGGLDGVFAALGAERMLWPRVEVEGGDGGGGERDGEGSLADAVQSAALEEWAAFASGALMLRSEVAELAGGNPLGQAVAVQRSERHAEIIASLRTSHRIPPYVDLEALLELLSAALTTFALRSASGSEGTRSHSAARALSADTGPRPLDPGTPEGWRRIEKTVGVIARALLDS
jgi:AcrR family transcriptional regulator